MNTALAATKALTEIFSDDLESQDTSEWSKTVGGL
jgi:hypothetical protein